MANNSHKFGKANFRQIGSVVGHESITDRQTDGHTNGQKDRLPQL